MWLKVLSATIIVAFLSVICPYSGSAETLVADRDGEKGWEKKARKEFDKKHDRNWQDGRKDRHSRPEHFDRDDRKPPRDGKFKPRRDKESGDYGRPPHRGPRPEGQHDRPFDRPDPGFNRPGEPGPHHPGGPGRPDRPGGNFPERR